MSNVLYEFLQDCHEKAITARSAKNRKRYPGKKGPVKLPSDYMTEKEKEALNGECKTYKLGAPMTWDEFSKMPDDLKAMYIKSLRRKFTVPDEELATFMEVDIQVFTECLANIKVHRFRAKDRSWWTSDHHGRFVAWWIGFKEEKIHG